MTQNMMSRLIVNAFQPVRLVCVGVCVLGMAVIAVPSFAADDLCPDANTEKHQSPDNVTDVQASIEKLNLCVERAKLLKQLDDIARERDEILTKVTSPVMPMSSVGGIPPLSGANLPPLPTDVTGLRPGDVRVTQAAGNPFDAAAQAVSSVIKTPSWKVRKIWGQGNAMRAQLSDGGTLLNVVKGDTMPDGRLVESVSIKGVAVSQKGKITELPWDDMIAATPAAK